MSEQTLSSATSEPASAAAGRTDARAWGPLVVETAVMLALAAGLIALSIPLMIAVGAGVFIYLDHNLHLGFARQMAASATPATPHFLYHLLVIGLYQLTGGIDWRLSTALAMTLPHVALGLIAYVLFRQVARRPAWMHRGLSAALALLLVIAVPPYLIGEVAGGAPTHPYLLGYISPTVYHNPTQTVLRPLALALFALTVGAVLRPVPRSTGAALAVTGGLAILVVLNGIAKPSFLIVLLPALALWTLIRLLRRQRVAWLPTIIGVALPGAAVLAWQYLFTYTGVSTLGASSIVIDPFAVVNTFPDATPARLALFLVLSLLLPLLLWLLGGRAARQDAAFTFGWLLAALGATAFYLLAETGARAADANFAWSAYIGMFVLCYAALRHAIRLMSKAQPARRGLTAAALLVIALHGVFAYILIVTWMAQLTVYA